MKMDLLSYEKDILNEIVNKYGADCNKYIQDAKFRVARKQYGKGGECLHRGYYCPSLIEDIIVGNVSRGKLCNKSCEPNYVYGFDSNDELIFVEHEELFEYIIHQDDVEIGIAFSQDDIIESISYCRYCNGKIEEYLFSLYNPYEKSIIEIKKEYYSYFDDKLIVDWSRCADVNLIHIQQWEKYIFYLNNGFLDTYIVETMDEKKQIQTKECHVNLKRKV